MGLESTSYLDGLVTTNPAATDSRSEGDDHIRLLKTALKNTIPGMAGRMWRTQTKSGAYTATTTDNMSIFSCTASMTLTFDDVATLGNGWCCWVKAASGATVTLAATSGSIYAGTSGASTKSLVGAASVFIACDGSNIYIFAQDMPSSTRVLFGNSAAPLGWSKVTSYNNYAVRLVSGSGHATGGSQPFTTVFGRTATDSHTLSVSEMPSHNHSGSSGSVGTLTALSAGAHTHTISGTFHGAGSNQVPSGSGGNSTDTKTTSSNGTHSHNVTGTINVSVASQGGGGGHTHPIDTRVYYYDMILCAKD